MRVLDIAVHDVELDVDAVRLERSAESRRARAFKQRHEWREAPAPGELDEPEAETGPVIGVERVELALVAGHELQRGSLGRRQPDGCVLGIRKAGGILCARVARAVRCDGIDAGRVIAEGDGLARRKRLPVNRDAVEKLLRGVALGYHAGRLSAMHLPALAPETDIALLEAPQSIPCQ